MAKSHAKDITLVIGHDELLIRQVYQTLSIANDICIGVIFLVGSLLFFSTTTAESATVLFVIGSALMLVRPCIRIARQVHLTRIGSRDATEPRLDY